MLLIGLAMRFTNYSCKYIFHSIEASVFQSSRVELLLLRAHKSQLSWFRLQVRMPPVCLPRGGVLGMSIQEEILGNTRGFLVLSAGLELPWDSLRGAGGSCWGGFGEGS